MDVSRGYAPWKGSSNDRTAELFGGADIDHHLSQGKTGQQMLDFITANPNKIESTEARNRIYSLAASERSSASSGGGGGSGAMGGSMGAGAFNPNDVKFNPAEIDMSNSFNESDYVMGLAKERAENFVSDNSAEGGDNASIVNNIEQNVGNKGDMETNIGDGNTINGSSIGNDFSLNMGNVALNNKINQGRR
jgi:hypothetical protein